jgi:hypothetical protein
MLYKIVNDFIVDLYLIYNDCHNNIPMDIKGNHENTIFKRYQFFKVFFVFTRRKRLRCAFDLSCFRDKSIFSFRKFRVGITVKAWVMSSILMMHALMKNGR